MLVLPYAPLDIAGPIDVIESISKTWIGYLIQQGVSTPKDASLGIEDAEFHHIGTTLEPVKTNGSFTLVPTTTPDVCPELDYLIVGGPDPLSYKLPENLIEFIRSHVAKGKVLFSICTGSMMVASTGVLDGKTAITTHVFVPLARKMYPKVNWKADKNWEVSEDGKLWLSAGGGCGIDMMLHWVKETYSQELMESGLPLTQIGPRDVHGKPLVLKYPVDYSKLE
ncbi:hypothetical protein MMC28_009310 [Mycoblastus sanguinarius]|nr:hypothetical protein [Mycoblastus sanguinarius]